MTTRILLAALAASAVVACGGEANSPTTSSSGTRGADAKAKKAMLNFAKCMRQHGVDMPDPKFDSGGGIQMTQKDEGDPAKTSAAEKACRHFQDEAKPPPMSEADQAEARKRGLANARCMRDHGINMPDPQFDADGRMTVRLDSRSGIDPSGPKFQAAQKACMKDAPGGIMAGGGEK
jgi:hypothetical protein